MVASDEANDILTVFGATCTTVADIVVVVATMNFVDLYFPRLLDEAVQTFGGWQYEKPSQSHAAKGKGVLEQPLARSPQHTASCSPSAFVFQQWKIMS